MSTIKKKKSRKRFRPGQRERKQAKLEKLYELEKEVERLRNVIETQALPLNEQPDLDRDPKEFYPASKRFDELPLSSYTQKALAEAEFETLTTIQRASIPHALAGRNVIGTAKTGSGKTLAFLVPVVERLFREEWLPGSGLAALIVSPTRELAMQTFENLKVVAKYHGLDGGLVIGKGQDLEEERLALSTYAIVVCTPGRLLMHLDESPDLFTDELQMLVFDECDRLLDLGFEKSVDAILGHLPPITDGDAHGLQCLMFSATNNVRLVSKRLGKVKFVDVDPHRHAPNATPNTLKHFVMHAQMHEKLTYLWSFIKQHLFAKMIVFVSTCKQARFVEATLRQLQATPGWIGAIHGRLNQTKRMAKYYQFRDLKAGILICTDVGSRGLDFPAVDWVIQMDLPEDSAAYVHRVGRTARLGGKGSALLFLMPSEEAFLNELGQKGIVPDAVEPDEAKLENPRPKLQALLSSDADLKYAAQKAFICYMRSLYLTGTDITQLPYKKFSQSLGLVTVPKIKFGKSKQKDKNAPYTVEEPVKKKGGTTSRIEKIMSKVHVERSLRDRADDDDDEADDFLVLEREDHVLEEKPATKKQRVVSEEETLTGAEWRAKVQQRGEQVAEAMQLQDLEDKMTAKERRRRRRMEEKKARKEERKRKQMIKQGLDPDAEEEEDEASVSAASYEEFVAKKQRVPSSLQEREEMALAMLGDDF